MYKLLDRGHHIHIFFSKGRYPAGLKDHIRIRYFPVPSFLFGYGVLFKLWERRGKKKVELIIADDENIFSFFNKFKGTHGANVLKYDSGKIMDFCEQESKRG